MKDKFDGFSFVLGMISSPILVGILSWLSNL